MRSTRLLTVALLAALAIMATTPIAQAPAQPDPSSAHAACKSAIIVGQRKCIARGQYCKHTNRANRDYHRYGYHCGKRDYRGSYHLQYY